MDRRLPWHRFASSILRFGKQLVGSLGYQALVASYPLQVVSIPSHSKRDPTHPMCNMDVHPQLKVEAPP